MAPRMSLFASRQALHCTVTAELCLSPASSYELIDNLLNFGFKTCTANHFFFVSNSSSPFHPPKRLLTTFNQFPSLAFYFVELNAAPRKTNCQASVQSKPVSQYHLDLLPSLHVFSVHLMKAAHLQHSLWGDSQAKLQSHGELHDDLKDFLFWNIIFSF